MVQNLANDNPLVARIALLRVALYRGIQAKVARRLKISESFVSRVASGKKKNLRVERELVKESTAIELLVQRKSQQK